MSDGWVEPDWVEPDWVEAEAAAADPRTIEVTASLDALSFDAGQTAYALTANATEYDLEAS